MDRRVDPARRERGVWESSIRARPVTAVASRCRSRSPPRRGWRSVCREGSASARTSARSPSSCPRVSRGSRELERFLETRKRLRRRRRARPGEVPRHHRLPRQGARRAGARHPRRPPPIRDLWGYYAMVRSAGRLRQVVGRDYFARARHGLPQGRQLRVHAEPDGRAPQLRARRTSCRTAWRLASPATWP